MSTAKTNTGKQGQNPPAVIETVRCCICNTELPKVAAVEFDGHFLCSGCLEDETFLCSDCGDRVWNDDNAGSDDISLCHRCYDGNYMRCEECGVVMPTENAYYLDEDDEYGYCGYCYDKLKDKQYIHGYSYKPMPIFYGDTAVNRYFGVELEIDGGGKDNDNAHDLLRTGRRRRF